MRNIYFTFIIFFINCNSFSDNNLQYEIKKRCELFPCKLELNLIVKSEWDKVYFFSEGCSLNEINTILGFPFEQYRDVGQYVVFVKKDSVVYYNYVFPGVDEPNKDQLNIKFGHTEKYRVINSNRPYLIVEKVEFSNGFFYEINP